MNSLPSLEPVAGRPRVRWVYAALLAYPAVFFLRGWMNAAMLLLLVLAPWLGGAPAPSTRCERRAIIAYVLAMTAMPLTVLVGEWSQQQWAGRFFDAPSRFLLAVPILFALRKLRPEQFRWFGPGLAAGAMYSLASIAIHPYAYSPHRYGLPFLHPIPFGDLALTFGVLSAMSIDWPVRDATWMRWFKRLGLVCGLATSLLSGSRGGWIALPFYGLWWLWFRRADLSLRRIALIVGAACVGAVVLVLAVPAIHQRVELIGSNLVEFHQGDPNTSIGIRLQLWHAAWLLIRDHLWFGVGPEGFRQAMSGMLAGGVLTADAAHIAMAENAILAKTLADGIFGTLAVLGVYLVPLAVFLRRQAQGAAWQRQAARMGLVLVTGYFIYGLSVEIFVLSMLSAFYALTCTLLLAATLHPASGAGDPTHPPAGRAPAAP